MTVFALSDGWFGVIMLRSVFRTSHNYKIFNSIIGFDSVNVVHAFIWFKHSSKMLGHYKDMFENVAATLCTRVSSFKNKDITLRANFAATFPPMMR